MNKKKEPEKNGIVKGWEPLVPAYKTNLFKETFIKVREGWKIFLELWRQFDVDKQIVESGTIEIWESIKQQPIPVDKCPFCEAQTYPGDTFCLNCGQKLPQSQRMFYPKK